MAANAVTAGSFSSALGGGSFGNLNSLVRSDVLFALALVAILVVLVLPMPPWLLDISLAMSITLSVMILMTSLFIEKPLEFSSFPTILLVATMMRLGLNVASTRLILSHGHEGSHAAGHVIQAFGNFVMGSNFVIGLIVFSILIIVNFVVITKGSGRIAEVSARFSLDAMPGKQMAIDADLSAGLIDDKAARARRKGLEDESNFYGAMDGAAKFVRGDAIAALLITFINIVGGIIIGVFQNDLTFVDASRTYTILTVGDGLVSQIPALIVSTAAGMLVSKAGVEGSADKALFAQLSAYPTSLGLSSFLMGTLALIPGLPMLPFLVMSGATGMAAWKMSQAKLAEEEALRIEEEKRTDDKPIEEPVTAALQMDHIRLELGYGLLSMLTADANGWSLAERIKVLRRQLAGDIGFVLPTVRIQDNLQLPHNAYSIVVKELEAGRGEVRQGLYMVMDPHGQKIMLEGEETTDPAFGMPAKWVSEAAKAEAEQTGLTVVDASTVITTHLSEMVKEHMSELLTISETQKLMDEASDAHKKLIQDVVPAMITLGGVQRILQNLLAERISIRDIGAILEAISEAVGFTRNINIMTEHVRARLARQITHAHLNADGVLPLIPLSPTWETAFQEALVGDGDVKQLAMAPTQLQEFVGRIRPLLDKYAMMGEYPVILTSVAIRPYVRSVIERFRPSTPVMSQAEVYPKAKVKTLEYI